MVLALQNSSGIQSVCSCVSRPCRTTQDEAAASLLVFLLTSGPPSPRTPPVKPGGGLRRRMLPTPPHCCALHQSVCVYESRRVRELLHRCLCESFLCLAEHLSRRIHFRDALFLFFLCSSSACRQATSTSVDVGVLPLHSSCAHKTKYCSMGNTSTAALMVITTAADTREVLYERFTCRYGNTAATV